MYCKVERIAYGAMAIEKAYIRWRRDTRCQTKVKLRLVRGLRSTFGKSNCPKKWHASLGSEAVLTVDNLQRGEFHYAVGFSYVVGMLRQSESSVHCKVTDQLWQIFSISECTMPGKIDDTLFSWRKMNLVLGLEADGGSFLLIFGGLHREKEMTNVLKIWAAMCRRLNLNVLCWSAFGVQKFTLVRLSQFLMFEGLFR